MKEIELKNVDYRIIDDETVIISRCPICNSKEQIVTGIYRNNPSECSFCKSKFNISMIGARVFKIENG